MVLQYSDVRGGVAVNHQQVGKLAWRDSAEFIAHAGELGAVLGGPAQDLQGGDAGVADVDFSSLAVSLCGMSVVRKSSPVTIVRPAELASASMLHM